MPAFKTKAVKKWRRFSVRGVDNACQILFHRRSFLYPLDAPRFILFPAACFAKTYSRVFHRPVSKGTQEYV